MTKANISTEKSLGMWCDGSKMLPLWSSSLHSHPHYNHEENTRQIPICLQNIWPILFKTIQVNKRKKSLRNCHSRGEPKENNYWMEYAIVDATIYKTREGNGTPLQYSCLENPMDGGAW